MRARPLFRTSLLLLLLVVPLTLFVASRPLPYSLASVTTSQYGNARNGANTHESILTPRNVNPRLFGKLGAAHVDGDVYAQPLYLAHVKTPGAGSRNIVFAATEHDSVYAFDADGDFQAPLWHAAFANPGSGIDTMPGEINGCSLIEPEIGITATPVIDAATGTIYVLARTQENGRPTQRLHALDVATGAEKFGGPVEIRAPGFDPAIENPRAALLLVGNVVHLSWASNCDYGHFHGWLMSYDARTLEQLATFNTSPQSAQGGIWAGDAGIAADARGNVFAATGNGQFDVDSGGADYGDSLLKVSFSLNPKNLAVQDFFTPYNHDELSKTDSDLGSGGPVLLPDQPGRHPHLVVIGGKGSVLYVLDRDRLGRLHPNDNSGAVQELCVESEMMGAPAFWENHLFVAPSSDAVKDYALRRGRFSEDPVAQSVAEFSSSATPTVTSDGARDGIVWTLEAGGHDESGARRKAVLHAFDAANVARELYNSNMNAPRDAGGSSLRFTIPTVVNGRVFAGARGEVDVYGLLPEVRAAVRTARR